MRVAIIGFLGLFAVGCGGGSSGSSNTAQCQEINTAICNRVFTCTQAASFRDTYGTSEADCVSTMNMGCRATSSCPTGQTFHADKAAQCVTATQAVTCDDIGTNMETALFPSVCNEVCTGP